MITATLLPAVLLSLNCRMPLLMMDALPAVLVFWKLMKAPLSLVIAITVPLPPFAVLPFWNTSELPEVTSKVCIWVELLTMPVPLTMNGLLSVTV